jgi:hypothetical protein
VIRRPTRIPGTEPSQTPNTVQLGKTTALPRSPRNIRTPSFTVLKTPSAEHEYTQSREPQLLRRVPFSLAGTAPATGARSANCEPLGKACNAELARRKRDEKRTVAFQPVWMLGRTIADNSFRCRGKAGWTSYLPLSFSLSLSRSHSPS